MTEQQLTEAAVLKAKAIQKEEKKKEKEIKDEVKEVLATAAAEPVSTPENKSGVEADGVDAEVATSKFPHTISLGNGKSISFNIWTGKTKKQINKLTETSSPEVDIFEKLLTILLTNHVDKPDMYLSDLEQQFVFLCIKDISLGDIFKYEGECSECGNFQDIITTTKDAVKYTKSNYPLEFKKYDIIFQDIDSTENLKTTINDYITSKDYDGITTATDIEIAMHIGKKDLTPLQVMEWMDTLDLKSLKEINIKLSECSPSITISSKAKCEECEKTTSFITDELPNIFSDLLE